MAFPPQYREPPPTLPSIIAPGNGRYRGHHDIHFGRSPAMSIPGLESKEDVPPPLPPPRVLPFGELPRSAEESRRDHHWRGHPAPSFTSGYGSMSSSCGDERPTFKRRDTGDNVNPDEGYASYASIDRSRESLPADMSVPLRFKFQTPADLYTDSMKRKLNPLRTSETTPPQSLLTSSMGDMSRRPVDPRLPPALHVPDQTPMHGRSILGSPGRITDTSGFSAASPRSATSFHHSPVEHHRLHPDVSDVDRSPRRRTRRNNSDDASSMQGGCEFTGMEEMEMDESTSMRKLHIDDACATAGQKRRAASPPSEEMTLSFSAGQCDPFRLRDVASRGSPTPRLAIASQTSPALSMVPGAVSRSSSYMSGVSMPATSITPANSYGRRSPGGVSPGGVSPTSCNSPYATPASLTHSPRTSATARVPAQGRTGPAASPRKLTDVQKPGSSKLQGFLMCECCPKKPKKFETAEELSAHEAEKQYECLFCGNRFKNKNEAERHQNSLHVRRHSWSCSALSGYDRAFHDSTNRPGEADTCGYCGDEFPRSGHSPGSGVLSGGVGPKHATEQDWDERIRHLQDVHKFRECNAVKKFYRADHFRQHLKHSHAGTSGKWTNMLENACMVEEEPSPR
ncbi:hypothetical protein HIM_01188 [Hirsutella minnesotensis 3608]|nr:hypothetical protein HIM_01188 [Hirsutella minnesotensis 3608]